MSKQKFDDYFVGLDIGTSSVGWAVANQEYKVLKFNKKSMWGVRRFEEAFTAADRRVYRASRRRLNRRKFRLNILKDFFEKALSEEDALFLTNLEDSSLDIEDKRTQKKYTLYNDDNYIDVHFHEKYPTIYHLRAELIKGSKKYSAREVYLAIHHMMKYRGHFLFDGELKSDNNIDEAFQHLNDSTNNLYDNELFQFKNNSSEELKAILKNSHLTVRDRNTQLKKYVNKDLNKDTNKIFNKIVSMIAGSKVGNIIDIFPDIELEEKIGIDFKSSSFDEDLEDLMMLDFEQRQLIEYAKVIYDWGLLEEIRSGEKYISIAKVNSYEQHGKDLSQLKYIVRKGASADIYNNFFQNKNNQYNYTAYVGNGYTTTATLEEFYKEVKKVLKKVEGFEKEKEEILSKIETNRYMPKQRVGSNGVIPHQLHLIELQAILENAKQYLAFLNDVDETGLSIADKIIRTFKFRIPYYVGPLNPYHSKNNDGEGNAWVVRLKEGKVYPWNFEEMIDVSKSAENFITRMTNNCSYLLNEKVLPKSSLLYQKYLVLNEINNIKLDGKEITVEMKQHLFDNLFVKQHRNVTKKQITKWLMDNNYINRNDQVVITGIDDQIKSKLTTLHDMKLIFGGKLPDNQMLEEIIYWITLFSDSKDILGNKIKEKYSDKLTDEQIIKLRNKNYGSWGRFSKELLEGLGDTNKFNEPTSIIQALFITNNNFMELLTDEYSYSMQIESLNQREVSNSKEIDYQIVGDLPISPAVKRSVWQTLKLMDEIISITGKKPRKIMLEMARGGGTKGKRTKSRKAQLIELYKNIKTDTDLLGKLENTDEGNLRSKKLYLYYTQRGRCMYSNDKISLDELYNNNIYDLDHIYPRSITKDDSLDNLVLVKKVLNQAKGDKELYEMPIKSEVYAFWNSLRAQGLISSQKYERLIRKDPLSDAEKAGFIARQLVETRQSTKTIANIFKQLYPESELVFVKAGLVSDFRNEQKNNDKETGEIRNIHYRDYIKLRDLNDLHHAKDAYLNIVVGNVYHTKFTSNPMNFIKKSEPRSYNLSRMYDKVVERNNQIAWIPGLEGSIKKVNQMMKRHDILTTWMVSDGKGSLFNQQLVKKGKGQVPIKAGKDPDKYGGYDSAKISHLVFAEFQKRGKKVSGLFSIPIYITLQKSSITNYLVKRYKIDNLKIVSKNIPLNNSILEIDGREIRITGSLNNNTRYYFHDYLQPVYSSDFNENFKKIEKIINPKINSTFEKEEITDEIYLSMYKELLKKSKSPLFIESTKKYIDVFEKNIKLVLDLDEKAKARLLFEMSKLIKGDNNGVNLSDLGLGTKVGVKSIGYNTSNLKSLKLVHKSITGLFENRVDLLK